MNKPNIFFRLTKVNVAKREVTGIATAELPDQSGEICDYEGTKPYYQKWSQGISKATDGKSLGNVREMHSNIAAGKITELNFDDANKAIIITAKVVDDSSFNKVLEGVLTGFSQGGEYVRRWKDGDLTRYIADPTEVSLVDLPCLAEATFEVTKADGAVEMRKFKTVTKTDAEPVQKWETTDGKTFTKKDDAIQHQATIDADDFATKVIGRVKESIANANAALDAHEGELYWKRDFSQAERDAAANNGHALPDGSFPINSEQDLKNAIHAVGRASDPAKAKAHIINRAKAMGLESLLPDDWKIQKADSETPKVDAFAVELGKDLIKRSEMHAEHAKHVIAIHQHAAHVMDHVHKAMHNVEAWKADHHTAIDEENVNAIHSNAGCIAEKCMKMTHKDAPPMSADHASHVHDMHKSATAIMDAAHKFLHHKDGVAKAMQHDAHDMAQLKSMHQNAQDICDKCYKMFGMAEGAEKTRGGAELQKALSENTAMRKALDEVNGLVTKLTERVQHLEKQPVRKGAVFAVDRTIAHEPDDGKPAVESAYKINPSALRLSAEESRQLSK